MWIASVLSLLAAASTILKTLICWSHPRVASDWLVRKHRELLVKELEALPAARKPPTPGAFVMWANNWVEFVSLVIPVPYLGQIWFGETTWYLVCAEVCDNAVTHRYACKHGHWPVIACQLLLKWLLVYHLRYKHYPIQIGRALLEGGIMVDGWNYADGGRRTWTWTWTSKSRIARTSATSQEVVNVGPRIISNTTNVRRWTILVMQIYLRPDVFAVSDFGHRLWPTFLDLTQASWHGQNNSVFAAFRRLWAG